MKFSTLQEIFHSNVISRSNYNKKENLEILNTFFPVKSYFRKSVNSNGSTRNDVGKFAKC